MNSLSSHIQVNLSSVKLCRQKNLKGHHKMTEKSGGLSLNFVQILPN